MKVISKLVLYILFFSFLSVNAQKNESKSSINNAQLSDTLQTNKKRSLLKKSIVPASLISVGLIINNSDFEKNLQENLRNSVGNDYQVSIDDYLIFVPIVQMYAADALGMEAKNHWFDQTKNLFISNAISAGITELLKNLIVKTRPDGTTQSFPSGHTSFAFTNAAVLQNEFQETSVFYAYSGYAFAATTGVFRMLNNRHYLSDVLVGAGIGIFITQLVYHFEPFKNFNPFKKSKNISLFPQYKESTYGFYFSYSM